MFFYGTGVRANLADPILDAMVSSDSYRGKKDVSALTDENLISTTYYVGEKGDEVADYSYNYKVGQRNNVKSTSVFFYGTGIRAISANPISDAMIASDSYRGLKDVATLTDEDLISTTYYVGEKGDEVANYSFNYKIGERNNVKSTSVFFYGTGVRADLADSVLDAMVWSDSYKGAKEVALLTDADLVSTTYYVGEKGDEVADYSYKY